MSVSAMTYHDVLDRLDRLRFISDLSFAPDGASLIATIRPAVTEGDKAEKAHIWRFGLDGAATQLTFGPSGEGHPRHAPAPGAFAFLSDREIKGKSAIYIVEDGREARRLGDLGGSVEDYRWTADGNAIVALVADKGVNGGATTGAARLWWGADEDPEVTTPRHARRRLFVINRQSGAAREVGPEDENVWEFDLVGDDTAAVIVSPDPSERGWHHARLGRLDLKTRALSIVHRPKWQIQGLAGEPGGNRVAFTEGWSSDRGLVVGEITVVDLATGGITGVASDALSSVTDLHWVDRDTLIFAGWDRLGSCFGAVGVDGTLRWQEHEDMMVGDSAFVARVSPGPGGAALAAIRETVGQPAEIFYRPQSGAGWTQLTELNVDVARDFPDYPEIRAINWTGRDELPLEGVLVLPRNRTPGPLPAIVDIHGGPCYTSKPQFNPSGALVYAAAGYAVFLPNYRGNVGWGQAFTKLDVGDPAGAEFDDILAGIDHCVARGWIDPDRLGVTGGSYGGYLTAWAVATTHRFKAAIMVSGIANQISCHYSCEHAFHEFINGGPLTEPKNFQMAVDRSPLWRLDKPTTPTLMLHGRDDRCTPLGQAQEFYAALLERGCEAEMVIYPGEGHGIRKPAHRRDAARRRLAWFDRYLRPEIETEATAQPPARGTPQAAAAIPDRDLVPGAVA